MAIREYDNSATHVQPTEVGIDSKMQAARRIGAFYGEAGDTQARTGARFGQDVQQAGAVYVDYLDHADIARGASSKAQLLDNLTKAWDDTAKAADAQDPTVAAKFRAEVLEPTLKQWSGNGFSTEKSQQWAENSVESLREHFFQKTAADMQNKAKDAVSVAITKLENSSANTAYRSGDFHTTDFLLKDTAASIKDIVDTSQVKGADASRATMQLTQKVRERIVHEGALKAIESSANPEATAAAWSAKYPEDIKDAGQLAKAARTQMKFNAAQDKQAVVLQKQIDTMAADKAGVKIISNLIQPDGTLRAAGPAEVQMLHDYTKMPGATSAHAEAMFNFLQKESKVEADNPASLKGLTDKMLDGSLQPIDLVKASVNHEITQKTFSLLEGQRKLIEEHPQTDPVFKSAMKGADAVLAIPTNQAAFALDFMPKYIAAKTKGELPANALDLKDPKSMISQSLAGNVPTTAQVFQHNLLKGAYFGMDIKNVKKELNIKPGEALPVPEAAPSLPWRGDERIPDVLRPMIRAGEAASWNADKTQIKIGNRIYDLQGKRVN